MSIVKINAHNIGYTCADRIACNIAIDLDDSSVRAVRCGGAVITNTNKTASEIEGIYGCEVLPVTAFDIEWFNNRNTNRNHPINSFWSGYDWFDLH